MIMAKNNSNKKTVPIQAFLRLRPPKNSEEYGLNVHSIGKKQIEIRAQCGKRQYSFDGIFDENGTQADIYNKIVKPMIPEVLAGYNCTVFAYGQTGTGKTYTMTGMEFCEENEHAGIIPRALGDLFDELSLLESDYSVRVWYSELYNEELYDLLSDSKEDCIRLKLFDDPLNKGSIRIHGIQEVTVLNKNEVFKILKHGQEKRRTAATLMNAQSSRSHTVFCITVHISDMSVDGEILVKIGKLYLVDLAGSENISRAGSSAGRARETGSINQSLLTLGRVIKTLVERCPHIPYRESKLTRILQDSLGGHTKTSIIATVSLSSANMDETISTLEYAHRARNITNRPEANQKISKTVYLKHYETQLERLRKDLEAARSGKGVTLAQENYDMLISENSATKEALVEKINRSRMLQEELQVTKDHMEWCEKERHILQDYYNDTLEKLQKTRSELEAINNVKEEQAFLLNHYNQSANQLKEEADNLFRISQQRTNEQILMHEKFEQLRKISGKNANSTIMLATNVQHVCQELTKTLNEYQNKSHEFVLRLQEDLGDLRDRQEQGLKQIAIDHELCHKKFISKTNQQVTILQSSATEKLSSVIDTSTEINEGMEEVINIIEDLLTSEKENQTRSLQQKNNFKQDMEAVQNLMANLQTKMSTFFSATEAGYQKRFDYVAQFGSKMDNLKNLNERQDLVMEIRKDISGTCSLINNSMNHCDSEMRILNSKIYSEEKINCNNGYSAITKETPLDSLSNQHKQLIENVIKSGNKAKCDEFLSICLKNIQELENSSECCRNVLQVPQREGDTPAKPSTEILPKQIMSVSPAPRVLQRFRKTREALSEEEKKAETS